MAVYGIGENKCLKEVVEKDNLFVFSGSISIDSKAYKGKLITPEELGETLESYNPADWAIVSVTSKVGSDPWKPPHFVDGAPNDTSPLVTLQQFLGVGSAGTIWIYNHTPYKQTCLYTAVLMKVK